MTDAIAVCLLHKVYCLALAHSHQPRRHRVPCLHHRRKWEHIDTNTHAWVGYTCNKASLYAAGSDRCQVYGTIARVKYKQNMSNGVTTFLILTLWQALSTVAVICCKAAPTVSGCVPVALPTALAALNTNRIALSGRMVGYVRVFVSI